MEAFFFVPGNRLHKIGSMLEPYSSNIIIDLEDAVKESERGAIMKQLVYDSSFQEHYIRLPLYDFSGERLDLLENLVKAGYSKFVFPKIDTIGEFEAIYPTINNRNVEVILLVETPRLFLETRALLTKYHECFSGIGLGSHDFMSVVGGTHSLPNLEYVRQHILYLAKAFNIIAIDIASMQLSGNKELKDEIMDGFNKGYDGKFFIHPWQIEVLKTIKFYSEEEHKWALMIEDQLKKGGSSDEFNPVVIDGQVIERPHLKRAERILKFYKHEGE